MGATIWWTRRAGYEEALDGTQIERLLQLKEALVTTPVHDDGAGHEVEEATGALEDVRAAAAAYEGALKAIHETGLEKLHAAEAVVVRALTHANEALARELDRRWHALLALLGAIEGCALVGCALYERHASVHT